MNCPLCPHLAGECMGDVKAYVWGRGDCACALTESCARIQTRVFLHSKTSNSLNHLPSPVGLFSKTSGYQYKKIAA